MIFDKRINIIMEMLNVEKQIANKKLMMKLNISESTLRRDLDYLEKKGAIKRVHGGAVLSVINEESSFISNEGINIDKKKIIAEKAGALLQDTKYIYLDAGTTTHELIDYITNPDLTVVTNGLMHIEKLMKKNINTVLLGGSLKESTKVTYGEMTIKEINNFNFDVSFIGANGIDKLNYTTADVNEGIIKKTAIENSNKSYILADSTKIGKKYFVNICSREIATLITEE